MTDEASLPDIEAMSPRVRAEGTMLPPMASYAQNFEDVLLRRSLQDVAAGFYVDVGAYDPEFHSVTKSLYDAGWTGINVEPHPDVFLRLASARPRDVNLNCAVGGESGRMPFGLVGRTGLSSLMPMNLSPVFGPLPVRVIDVPVLTLDEICGAHAAGRTIDFLKIDVEGAEAAVLRGARLDRNRPRIVVAEATHPMSQEPAWGEWEPLLLEAGYHFACFDGLNRFYVRDEDRNRLAYFRLPPCCFDNVRVVAAGSTDWMFEMPASPAAPPSDLAQPPAPTGLEVRVPVSIGELIDKISILEIKSERIVQPERLANIRHELSLLQAERDRVLSPLPEQIATLAVSLKRVNELIWDAEDVIHGPDAATLLEQVFLQQAHIAFDQNDVRARLKRSINELSHSTVVEEKSYPDFGGAGR